MRARAGAGRRWRPSGVYVPGGRAAYPSTVLMNAVPAQVAGVDRIAMVTPPGKLEPAVLAAAKEAGVTEIWRDRRRPGRGRPGLSAPGRSSRSTRSSARATPMSPPPSAGSTAWSASTPWPGRPRSWWWPTPPTTSDWIAADLLSQAEHDPAAQSILITDDEAFAQAVVDRAVDAQLDDPGHRRGRRRRPGATTGRSSSRRWTTARAWSTCIAPEHVEFAVDDPERLADRVRHAGAIFLGRLTPEAIGDYVAGSNHVLPTSRAARFSVGPVDLRLPQAHLDREVRRGPFGDPGAAHRGPGGGRGPAGPRPVGGDAVGQPSRKGA